MNPVFQNLLAAFRSVVRRPRISSFVVATMALGVGASTAVFTVADQLLLAPLPYRDPGQLVTVWQTVPDWKGKPIIGETWDRLEWPYPAYRDLAENARTLSAVGAAYWAADMRLTVDGETDEVPIANGSSSLLPLLGVRPRLGRWFLPGEEGPGAPAAVVLSDAVWRNRFGADPGVVGRSIVLDETQYQVVGVLPSDFRLRSLGRSAGAFDGRTSWLPIGAGRRPALQANSNDYEVIARLREGASLGAAEDEAARLVSRGRDPGRHGARILDRKEAETGSLRPAVVAVALAVGLLLALTCLNVAVLLLGDGAIREREISTRVMIGATRRRIVAQLLLESGVLASAAGLIGLGVAVLLTRLLVGYAPDELNRLGDVAVDWRAFAFGLGLAIVAGLAAGLGPAFSIAKTPGGASPGSSRTATARTGRLQRGLIAGQVAVTMLLLVGGTLLGTSLLRKAAVDPGFRVGGLLLAMVELPSSRYSEPASQESYFGTLMQRIAVLPSIGSVGLTTSAPFAEHGGSWAINPAGEARLELASPTAAHAAVSPGYLETMGIPILAGRGVLASDGVVAERVAVVNEDMARRFWPGEDPIGRRFFAPNGGARTIVGIAGNVRHDGLGAPAAPGFYESLGQAASRRRTLVIRATGDLDRLARQVAAAAREIDPLVPVRRIVPMQVLLDRSLASERFRLVVLAAFATAAVALTLVGVVGTVLRTVAARMRELCIRMATGATTGQVAGLIIRQFATAALVGVASGGLVALWLMRVAESWLFGVTSRDPMTYGAVAALLLGATVLAAAVPMRRLRRVDLLVHLRRE